MLLIKKALDGKLKLAADTRPLQDIFHEAVASVLGNDGDHIPYTEPGNKQCPFKATAPP